MRTPFSAALREFQEETGVTPQGAFLPLAEVRQPGGKLVRAWALEAPCDNAPMRSNTFEMEWPPRSAHRRTFPEIDRAEWFPLDTAHGKILKGQLALLDQVQDLAG